MDKQLPRYSHEKLLGEGGMGKVYLANDNQLQRKVAIKELTFLEQRPKCYPKPSKKNNQSKIAKNKKVNHALQEARLLARVNHANIIQIYNIIDEGEYTALVMEYFKSKTLTQYQNEAQLTLIQKLDLLRQLSAGLAAAHQNGVIHCDLKPSNILVNEQYQLKITDFGIACLSTPVIGEEESAKPIQYGSLYFMSPEQIKNQTLDYRTDIFSFGIIAYQVIVGSHPFNSSDGKSSSTEVAGRICEHTPEHAKNLMLDAPIALTDLLMQLLVKPIEQRILTAAKIENRLTHIQSALQQTQIDEQPTLPLTYTKQVKAEKTPKKLKQKSIKVFSVICLFCIVSLLSIWIYNTQKIETKQVVILRPTLTNSPLMAPMQQDLVISAIEDALRQSVINTNNMYLVSQREVKAITKEYPDDLKKLRQAVGASDIITTSLECNNTRCKVSFSRLVANQEKSEVLKVESEQSWIAPIEKFNPIYNNSQTHFARLYPEHSEVNQSGLVQRPINEDDYRQYIELYSKIMLDGGYSEASLNKLKKILTRSPYLYAAYSLYRETAINLYSDFQDEKHLKELALLLQNSPPEYRYSIYHSIDSFWLAFNNRDLDAAKQQMTEAKNRGASDFILVELKAVLFFSNSQYDKAAKIFNQAITLRPSTVSLYNLAFTYWRMGELKMSENTLDELFKVLPNEYQSRQLLTNIWLLQGRLALAINAYEKIVAQRSNGQNLTNLSLTYALNHQYEKSLEYAKLAVSKSPKHTTRLSNLADIEMILGKKELAKSHYQQVINAPASRNKTRYWLDLAQAYLHTNQANLAVDSLSRAKALAPGNGEVAYTSALIYSVLGEQISAALEVKKALNNKVGSVWFNLPWFDKLCNNDEFRQSMIKFNNSARCQV